MTIYEAS